MCFVRPLVSPRRRIVAFAEVEVFAPEEDEVDDVEVTAQAEDEVSLFPHPRSIGGTQAQTAEWSEYGTG